MTGSAADSDCLRGGEERYHAPAVLASYSTAELVNNAVNCLARYSDEALKDDIRPVERPLDGLNDLP